MQLREQLAIGAVVQVIVGLIAARIHQVQHHVGITHRRPSALNADFFHHIHSLAQPRGVDDVQRHAFDLNRL